MKIQLNRKRRAGGFVLILVMVLAACSLIILGGVLYRTSTVSYLNLRSTQLLKMNNAAEGATEKVYAQMAADFAYGPGVVSNNYAAGKYSAIVPCTTDNVYLASIQFSDGGGNIGQTHVMFLTNYNGPMPTQYTNQFATTSPIYRIISNAQMSNSLANTVIGTAQEDLMLALVPITTYAIFYNGNLEFSDCATMLINGRVHSNGNICAGAGSGATLTFNGAVTCVGTMSAPERGGVDYWTLNDPSTWLTTFNAGYTTNVPALSLSMNMTNTHSIIDVAPAGESPLSNTGQQRLENEAEIVVVVTNGVGTNGPTVYVTLQVPYNGTVAANDPSKTSVTLVNATDVNLDTNGTMQVPWLSLTNTFADQRQNQSSQYVSQIDVGQLSAWMNTNTVVGNGSGSTGKFTAGNYPEILYVADQRGANGTKQAAVRLVNASQLPYNNGYGFSVATENPIYLQGNYNTQTSNSVTHSVTTAMGLGTTTNGGSVPSAILADAITILSPGWQDADSGWAYSSRPSASTNMTINAAFVTGAMPSTGTDASSFSGGVQNLTRFLENWTGKTLTLNTSIVNLFNSRIATNQFQMPGVYYNPPTRNWGFDTTYYSPSKQPPGAPCALVPIRFNWQKPPPNTISAN